jgi:hypothetical protein
MDCLRPDKRAAAASRELRDRRTGNCGTSVSRCTGTENVTPLALRVGIYEDDRPWFEIELSQDSGPRSTWPT